MEGNKKALDWLKNLSKEDIEKMAAELDKSLQESYDKSKAFFESKRFKEVITLLKQEVGQSGAIGDNPYQEPLFANVSNEEFVQLFSVLFYETIAGCLVQKEEDATFETYYVDYEGLKFIEIHGQGTAFIVQGPDFKQTR